MSIVTDLHYISDSLYIDVIGEDRIKRGIEKLILGRFYNLFYCIKAYDYEEIYAMLHACLYECLGFVWSYIGCLMEFAMSDDSHP